MQKFLYRDLYELEEKHWWHLAKRKLCHDLLAIYATKGKTKFLDIGCGTGKNLELFNSFGRAWGIDAYPEAIKFCQKRGLKRISVQTAERTMFKAKTFGLVSMLDVLEHIDEDQALDEARRILQPGGLLLITVPAYQWLWSQWDVVLKHRRRYNKETLTTALKKNGFRIMYISYFHSTLLVPTILVRWMKGLFSRENYGSDFRLFNPLINSFFAFLSSLELPLVVQQKVPFGLSLVCIAKKTAE